MHSTVLGNALDPGTPCCATATTLITAKISPLQLGPRNESPDAKTRSNLYCIAMEGADDD